MIEKVAQRLIAIFDKATMKRDTVENLAWWVVYLAEVEVLAKIILFCEKVLENDSK